MIHNTPPTKVVIFDDNQERRESLDYFISMFLDLQVVGKFENCIQVEKNIKECEPDVVLMDIDMPEVSGIEGVKRIKTNFPNGLVLMQTVFEDDEKVFKYIRNGASGYLLKKTSPSLN
jgi:DNA-binding NarL/FixJ family response regulator